MAVQLPPQPSAASRQLLQFLEGGQFQWKKHLATMPFFKALLKAALASACCPISLRNLRSWKSRTGVSSSASAALMSCRALSRFFHGQVHTRPRIEHDSQRPGKLDGLIDKLQRFVEFDALQANITARLFKTTTLLLLFFRIFAVVGFRVGILVCRELKSAIVSATERAARTVSTRLQEAVKTLQLFLADTADLRNDGGSMGKCLSGTVFPALLDQVQCFVGLALATQKLRQQQILAGIFLEIVSEQGFGAIDELLGIRHLLGSRQFMAELFQFIGQQEDSSVPARRQGVFLIEEFRQQIKRLIRVVLGEENLRFQADGDEPSGCRFLESIVDTFRRRKARLRFSNS